MPTEEAEHNPPWCHAPSILPVFARDLAVPPATARWHGAAWGPPKGRPEGRAALGSGRPASHRRPWRGRGRVECRRGEGKADTLLLRRHGPQGPVDQGRARAVGVRAGRGGLPVGTRRPALTPAPASRPGHSLLASVLGGRFSLRLGAGWARDGAKCDRDDGRVVCRARE